MGTTTTEKAELMDAALRTERDRLRKMGDPHSLRMANHLNHAVLELSATSKAKLHDIIKRFDTAEQAYGHLIEEGHR